MVGGISARGGDYEFLRDGWMDRGIDGEMCDRVSFALGCWARNETIAGSESLFARENDDAENEILQFPRISPLFIVGLWLIISFISIMLISSFTQFEKYTVELRHEDLFNWLIALLAVLIYFNWVSIFFLDLSTNGWKWNICWTENGSWSNGTRFFFFLVSLHRERTLLLPK